MKGNSIQRICAFLIDVFLIGIGYTVIINMMPQEQLSHHWILNGRSIGWSFDISGFLTAIYFVGSTLLNKGESPGKDILHLRTVSVEDGTEPNTRRSMARTLLKLISIWMLPVAALLYLWKGRGFTLQDYLVQTTVRPAQTLKAS